MKENINKRKIIQLVSLILALGIAVLAAVLLNPSVAVKAQGGTLDLTDVNAENTTVNLDGEWDFYWNKLLTGREISGGAKPDIKANVNSYWNTYKIDGEKLPAFGYATYALKIINAPVGSRLAVKIPAVSSAYEFYADDVLLSSGGKVGTDAETHKPETKYETVEFTVLQPDFYIVMRVSNFSSAYGGMYYSLTLGSPAKINKAEKTAANIDIFSLGGLLTMIVYYLGFTFFGKRDKPNRKINVLLVLLCLLYGLRILIHNEFLLYKIFPFTGFSAATVLDYLLLFWFSVCGIYLFGALFPKESHKKMLLAFLIYGGIMSIIVIATPISFFTRFVILYEIVAVVAGLYSIVGLSLAFLRGRTYAALLLACVFVVLICTLYDFLFRNVSVFGYTGGLVPLSILFLLILQPFLHAHYATESLEKMVAAENAFMQAQIKPHFIYNVLSVISAYCDTDPIFAQKLIDDFSSYLRLSFDFKKIESSVPIEREISLVKAYAEIQKARFPDFLSIDYDIGENTGAEVPLLSIQPLVENAIIHGILKKDKPGNVKIKISAVKEGTAVSVSDDGAGIPPDKLKNLISEESERGIGLYNIDKRLKKFFGKGLTVKSEEGLGTTVGYIIPAVRRKKK